MRRAEIKAQSNIGDGNFDAHRFDCWNDTDAAYPLDKCLHEFIDARIAERPSAPAVTFEGETISYAELGRLSSRLAHFLRDKGVGPETLVGVCAFRSIDMVVALLAILKAGGAYVPFDPTYPQQRLRFMIDDSQVPIMLAQARCRPLLSGNPADTYFFEDIRDRTESLPSDPPQVETTPDNLAYVIYTSGSTGNPKGAMNTHRAIVNRLLWMQDTLRAGPEDTLIQKTPFSFDVSVWEFFWPFMVGARLVVARPEGHKDAQYLIDLIYREQVSIIHFVPSMLHLFLDAADKARCGSLRHVVLSGEALTMALQRRYFSILDAPLHNLYGPTEAAVDVAYWRCDPAATGTTVPIGKPIRNTQLHILDENGRRPPIGESGELHIGGVQVARGYLNRPELTAEKFIPDPFKQDPAARLYKTGDLCRYMPDGNIEYLERIDFQVKIRGNRIELGEIEARLLADPSVCQCAVTVREDNPGDKRLVAYVVGVSGRFAVDRIRETLRQTLPDYMIPSVFVALPELPLTPSGKTDRRALPEPGRDRPLLATPYIRPNTAMEKKLAARWCHILKLNKVGIDDNFFDLGGDSLLALKLVVHLKNDAGIVLPVVKIFQYPTIALLAAFLDNDMEQDRLVDDVNERATRQRIGRFHDDLAQDGVAIIGMAGRFPGADSIEQLWDNLCGNVESISWFSKEELAACGIDSSLIDDPDYVPARGIINNADRFDAAFFGIGPQEAKLMDPQQRVFLELAWEAMERAGYDSESFSGMIGVYAGIGDNHYYPFNVLSHPDLVKMVGPVIVGYGNEKDYIATRVSYALNLTGPSVSANTGCSTSLLAVDNAFRALVDHECDLALAGGVDICVPQKSGFLYQPDGIFCKDGHCRPFDKDATGTMFCDGAGIVVLKRLSEAIADGDRIYAVIRGTAKNNDGANKVSFLAPSIDGQAKVIAMAQAHANVAPEDIGYIEAHGTGTPMGDPVEIEALTKVFRSQTDKKQRCRIGCIKGNIGHPTIASGVAGLMKAALCLYHEKIPATLHFKQPNDRIDFANSPFQVVDALTEWKRSSQRRIAAVSSFGFGGTNVHTILEEAPVVAPSGAFRPRHLLLLSGKTDHSVDEAADRLATYLTDYPETPLADIAFTLQCGRRHFPKRRYLIAADAAEAIELLSSQNPIRGRSGHCETRDPEIVFMFPGQGAQYVNMGKNLYDGEPLFRTVVDECCDILKSYMGSDLRDYLYPEDDREEIARLSLENTFYTQPAIFTIEYALARLLQHWGIRPSAMIGHSVGEFVCACLSGVFTLSDALKLVSLRGRLIQDLPRGSMLSVRKSADEIEPELPDDIQLAAANSPQLCVVSGPDEAIDAFKAKLDNTGVPCRRLHTSHAFHSQMMDPIVDAFIDEVRTVALSAPQIPFVSTVTTDWITEAECTDPIYWGRHLRMPVRFSNGIDRLLSKDGNVFLEVGPRVTCATMVRQHLAPERRVPVTSTLSDTHAADAEWAALLFALGYLWLKGVQINWAAFYANERRHRYPLPTYPFEPTRFWLDAIPRTDRPVMLEEVRAAGAVQGGSKNSSEVAGDESNDALSSAIIARVVETSGMIAEDVDPCVTFLEMGLDSLLLSQLAYRIQSDFGVRITFGQLMKEFSTVQILVGYIREQRRDTSDAAATAMDLEKTAGKWEQRGPVHVSLTVPQRGLWLSSKISNELSCAYNESITLQLKGEISIPQVETALFQLVLKHDAFRSVFSEDGKRMIVLPEGNPDIQHVDLSAMEKKDAITIWEDLKRKDASTEFDLEHGPLLRCHIVSLPENLCFVMMTSHHIVCDGWSLDVIISDFCVMYSGLLSGESAALLGNNPYADFVYMVAGREKTDAHLAARQYWTEQFEDSFPVLQLPKENAHPLMGAYNARRIDVDVPSDIAVALKVSCKKNGWSVFAAFVAAYSIMLYRISGQDDFVVGLPIAEQPMAGKNDLVGHCVSLLPLRCHVDSEMSFKAYVDRVQDSLLGLYSHQTYSFIHMLDEANIPFSGKGTSPLPAGLTTVKRYESGELTIPGVEVDYFANPRAFESFECYLNVIESAESIELKCHYKSELFRREAILNWLEIYKKALTEISTNSAITIGAPIDARPRKSAKFQYPSRVNPAENPLEKELLMIWRKAFSSSSIGVDDNFFDIGGHSILAARVFAEIERKLCKTIPLSTLLKAPTVRQLANVLQVEGAGSVWKFLVPFNTNGSRPPVFLIHGAEGNILLYRDLAKYLGSDQPVYGIQSSGLDNRTEIDADFITVAKSYIQEIKTVQPSGPYYLGGYCLGGTISLEIAQQLKSMGEEVGLLFMIENFNIKTIRWPLPLYLTLVNKMLNGWYHVENMFSKDNSAKMAFLKSKVKTEWNRLKIGWQIALSSLIGKCGFKGSLNFPHVRIDEAYDAALCDYYPESYEGKIVLFGAQKRLAGFNDTHYGWGEVACRGIEIFELPINPRGSLVEPYVRLLASHLANCLDQSKNGGCGTSGNPGSDRRCAAVR